MSNERDRAFNHPRSPLSHRLCSCVFLNFINLCHQNVQAAIKKRYNTIKRIGLDTPLHVSISFKPHMNYKNLKKLCSEQEQARAYLRPAGECEGHDRYLETCTGLSGVHHPRRCRHLAPFSLQQLCDTLFAERLIHAECSVDTAPIEQS